MGSFSPKLTRKERELIRKFGGHDRTMGIYVEAQRCQLELLSLWRSRRCPSRWSQLPHECKEHLGHRDSGTPHRCRCGRTWIDRELRRARRKVKRARRGWWQRMVKAWKDSDPGLNKHDGEDDPDWETRIW